MKWLFFFLLAFTYACQSKEASSHSQVLHLNIYTEPPMLDPRQTTDMTSCNVLCWIGEGLTSYNHEDEITLASAASYTLSDDKLTYTFTLRDNCWSDGSKVTAYNFAAAWLDQLDPLFPSAFSYKLFIIQNALEAKKGEVPLAHVGIKPVDDETLQVTLTHPCPYFLELLASPLFFPINHRVTENNPCWAMEAGPSFTSNGPFQITSWDHDHEIILTPNPHYWNKEDIILEKVHLSMIDDTQTELYLFEQGKLDWAGAPLSALPSDSLPSLSKSPSFRSSKALGVYFLMLNTEVLPLCNKKIRQALSYAVPREALVEHVLAGEHTPAFSFVPPLTKKGALPLIGDAGDEMAQKLFQEGLDELNLTSKQLPKITITYNTSRQHQQMMQAIAEHWMKLFPIHFSLEVADWKVHLAKVSNHDFQIARFGWMGDYSDPMAFLESFQYADNQTTCGCNSTNWEDPEFTALLEKAKYSMDDETRQSLMEEAERRLIDAMPLIPVFFLKHNSLVQPWVQNIHLSPLGMLDIRYARKTP